MKTDWNIFLFLLKVRKKVVVYLKGSPSSGNPVRRERPWEDEVSAEPRLGSRTWVLVWACWCCCYWRRSCWRRPSRSRKGYWSSSPQTSGKPRWLPWRCSPAGNRAPVHSENVLRRYLIYNPVSDNTPYRTKNGTEQILQYYFNCIYRWATNKRKPPAKKKKQDS